MPVGVEPEVLTVKVEDPEPGTDLGPKSAVAPEGDPVTPKITFPVNPFEGVTLTAYFVLFPGETVCDDGVTATEKPDTNSFTCVV